MLSFNEIKMQKVLKVVMSVYNLFEHAYFEGMKYLSAMLMQIIED